MPEYLAPGVYVEEVSFRSKSIEGVSTTTTGFIGPTRYGPTELTPELLTSLLDFEHIYGDGQPLVFADDSNRPIDNYMWHAARAFFEEGGKRLYVVRTFRESSDGDGRASALLPATALSANAVQVEARFSGSMGQRRLQLTLNVGQNVLGVAPDPTQPGSPPRTVAHLQDFDVVWLQQMGSPITPGQGSPLNLGAPGEYYLARRQFDDQTQQPTWFFSDTAGNRVLALADLNPDPSIGDQLRVVTVTVTVFPSNPFDLPSVWANLPLDPQHASPGGGVRDSLGALFAPRPGNLADEYRLPIIVNLGSGLSNGVQVLRALIDAAPAPAELRDGLTRLDLTDASRSFPVLLSGGDDGLRPGATEYEGSADPGTSFKSGLKALEDLDDVAIVAAPGSTFEFEDPAHKRDAQTVVSLLIAHTERMRYRIAVLDCGNGQTVSQVRSMRGLLDSKYAALYYPWVRILDPITRREINVPPSGFVAGIYARNDITRAVYKAPANEVVNLALGFELTVNKGQQDVLNPEGVNCFRFFEGRGYRLWGARTISSDPEWKYVNLRRYFAYLEHSIDKGTQWAVFEPNGEALWANVRRTIEDFLFNEWQSGALLGDKPEKAFFVRCDRSTMTQNDLDNGRLVCLIGVVALKPAEFVIFRIGQATADSMRRAA
jgi:uncharacterized protein